MSSAPGYTRRVIRVRAPGLRASVVAALVVGAVAAPTGAAPLTAVSGIVAGYGHSCTRMDDGTVRCFGENADGQLGDGTIERRLTPVVVRNAPGTGPLAGVAQVAAGDMHSCARKQDGTVRCWGDNFYGQLGDGTGVDSTRPVEVDDTAGVGRLRGVVQIASEYSHSCARRADGSVRCWGWNRYGQLGDGTTEDRFRPVVVANGAGTGPIGSVAQLAAGLGHTCALRTDRTVRCWGWNAYGQLGDGTHVDRARPVVVANGAGTGPLRDVVQLSAGLAHTCAVRADATVRCWGAGHYGQLGDGVTTGAAPRPVAVSNAAGTGLLAAVHHVTAGDLHSCARMQDGTVRCWGANFYGQLGDGTHTGRRRPVAVDDAAGTGRLGGVTRVSAGLGHSCARIADGTARCWGDNWTGQLGDGTRTERIRPVAVVS
jgi:alpha-tubulin suppressor-like RCC1 family protein